MMHVAQVTCSGFVRQLCLPQKNINTNYSELQRPHSATAMLIRPTPSYTCQAFLSGFHTSRGRRLGMFHISPALQKVAIEPRLQHNACILLQGLSNVGICSPAFNCHRNGGKGAGRGTSWAPAPLPQDICTENEFWEELFSYFPSYDTERLEHDAPNNSSIVMCVFVATGTCLLPSNDTRTDTQIDRRDLRSMPLRWAQVP
jgi:hypothetical protein